MKCKYHQSGKMEDLNICTCNGVIPSPWRDVRELLVKYSQYLQDCGYLDDDWWSEEPISVDRFLAELPSPPEGVQG